MESALEEVRKERGVDSLHSPITWQEQVQLCSFYERGILRATRYSYTVQATAITYIRRFYLFRSVLQYNPKEIAAAALFLATKTENEYKNLDEFCKEAGANRDTVVATEYVLSDGLNYHFSVSHPYSPLHGVFLDFQTRYADMAVVQQIYDRAIVLASKAVTTDTPFLYQPSQIALAVFMSACAESGKDFEEIYLKHKFGQVDQDKCSALVKTLTEIRHYIEGYKFASSDEIKGINERLKAWVATSTE